MKNILIILMLMLSFEGISQNLPLSAGVTYPLSGTLYHSGNSYVRRSLTPTYFGYSNSYRVLMLGSASANHTTQEEGSVTLSFGYDPSTNTNGAFTGDGREVLFRNGVAFTTPNTANNGYHLNNLVLKDGKVGIGTNMPNASLEIASGKFLLPDGTNNTPSFSFSNGSDVGLFRAGSGQLGVAGNLRLADGVNSSPGLGFYGEGGLGIYRSAPGNLSFVTGNAEALRINETGKIGIGTLTVSAARLQVSGGQLLETSGTNSATRTLTIMQEGGQQANYGAYLGHWRSALQIQGNDNQYILHIVPPEVDYGYSVFRSTNAGIKFATGGSIENNGNDALTITHDGSVGINTGNPSEKLSVNGNIRSKKVIVSQTGWPDYVFDSSYKIKPLSEVEQFIQINKRLPEMPSAKEVEEKGVSVGDNQALLLKKIEELTLYLIELRKENIEIKKQMQVQANEIQELKNGK